MSTLSPTSSAGISFGLSGRVCLVTGGAQGIGEACIRRFAREGAQVVIADIDNSRGAALASELGGLYVHCDVGDKAQVDALVAQTMAAHGRIDVLVNNAGIFRAADFLEVTEADFDAVLTIPTIASYNVSKGGINQLTRVMALALADKGVRVNAVAPGTIATELAAKAVLTSPEATARIMSRTPMKRLGQPSEIADTVAYLASDAASYITGEIVVVDGGRMTLNYTVAV